MLWDRQAAQLAEAMRDQIKSARILWPWDIHASTVRVHGSNIRLCLYFTPNVDLVTMSASRRAFAGITIQPMRWRTVAGTKDVRTLLRECVGLMLMLMLIGVKQQAQRAGHAALVASIDAQADKPCISWPDEQNVHSAGEAA